MILITIQILLYQDCCKISLACTHLLYKRFVVIPQKWGQESFDLVSHFAVSQNRSSVLDVTKYVLYLCSDIGTVVLAINS